MIRLNFLDIIFLIINTCILLIEASMTLKTLDLLNIQNSMKSFYFTPYPYILGKRKLTLGGGKQLAWDLTARKWRLGAIISLRYH